ncbi:MAG: hypothetical protein QNJ38_07115 [Prochloraceae cyanobacterium]|nr:hypothetical protein [Prochloraceae cyanobacterium]
MDFLFKKITEFFYLASLKEDALSFAQELVEQIDKLDGIVSEKIKVYSAALLNYIYNNFNFNQVVAWIPSHIVSTILIIGSFIFILKKISVKQDKIGVFLKNINRDITKISTTVDRLNSLSQEELDYLVGVLDEITNDLRFLKYQIFNSESSVNKYQKEIKQIEIITSDMANRVQSGKATEKLGSKMSQLKKIIASYSVI